MVREIEEDASASIIPECWTNSLPSAVKCFRSNVAFTTVVQLLHNITLSCGHVERGSAVSEGARSRLDRDSGFLVHVLPRINKPSYLRGRWVSTKFVGKGRNTDTGWYRSATGCHWIRQICIKLLTARRRKNEWRIQDGSRLEQPSVPHSFHVIFQHDSSCYLQLFIARHVVYIS